MLRIHSRIIKRNRIEQRLSLAESKKERIKKMETMTIILGAVIAIAAVVSNFTIIK